MNSPPPKVAKHHTAPQKLGLPWRVGNTTHPDWMEGLQYKHTPYRFRAKSFPLEHVDQFGIFDDILEPNRGEHEK